jgi:SulP family sulfate permease
MIAAMVVGGVYAYLLRFVPGFALAHHIQTVPPLPGPLPTFSPPRFSLEALRKTASAAFVVGIVGLTEATSIARAIGARSEQRIDANQEFIGQGLANIAGAFFSAYAASGSLNRTGINYEAGAKTPLSSIFSALFLVVVLFAVAPLAAYLPIAAMAGVLLLVGWGLIDFRYIGKVLRVSRSETVVLVVTLAATLFAELGFAIYLGVILSIMLYLRRTAQPRIVSVIADPADYVPLLTRLGANVKVVRIRGSIFFGAASHVREALQDVDVAGEMPGDLVIDASRVNFIDASGAQTLAEEALRRRRNGGGLYLYGVNDEVLRVLRRSGRLSDIGAENVLPAYTAPRADRTELARVDAGR